MSQQRSLQVLGLSRGADSNAVNRAYKRLVFENRQNDAEKARIESAHSSIMMSQLSARMKASNIMYILPGQSHLSDASSSAHKAIMLVLGGTAE